MSERQQAVNNLSGSETCALHICEPRDDLRVGGSAEEHEKRNTYALFNSQVVYVPGVVGIVIDVLAVVRQIDDHRATSAIEDGIYGLPQHTVGVEDGVVVL